MAEIARRSDALRSVQELARMVQRDAAIALASAHASGMEDDATATDNIEDAANNRQANRSSYTDPQTGDTGPGGTVALDAEMLQGMLDLADQFTFNVSEIAGGVHSANSRHYAGVCFDVNILNGRVVNASHPDFRGLMQSARDAGATEVLGPGDPGHATHVHLAWPRNVEDVKKYDDRIPICENGPQGKSSVRSKTMTERSPDFLKSHARLTGTVKHIVTVQPATGFEYRYQSSTGSVRVIHLERGALESRGGGATEVLSFRAGVSPIDNPTRGGFFTSPDSIPMIAEAHILIDGGVASDLLICRSFGSWNGLQVTLKVFRENEDGSTSQILQEQIQNADEHTFLIP